MRRNIAATPTCANKWYFGHYQGQFKGASEEAERAASRSKLMFYLGRSPTQSDSSVHWRKEGLM